MKKFYLAITLILSCTLIFAQDNTASTGSWTSAATWSLNRVPAKGDRIIIPTGVTVSVPMSTSVTGSSTLTTRLLIYGTLSIQPVNGSGRFSFPAGSGLYILTGGTIQLSCAGCNNPQNDDIVIGSTVVWVGDGNYGSGTAGKINGPKFNTGQGSWTDGAGGILPVTFGAIKATEKGTGVQIDWTSYSEQNLANYQIERSADGINFASVGEVAPRNAAAETQYGFFDALPLSGTSFYRIRNNDIDGKSGLSNIVKINLNKNIKTIGIYPNPVIGNRVSFQTSDLTKGTYNVEVINAFGARVFQQSVNHAGGAINQSLNLPNLNSGSYTLRINGTSTTSTHKITILQ
jgi:hypothetical protein